jgi:5-deoxy-5-amino-3-dehydroquinate synthase
VNNLPIVLVGLPGSGKSTVGPLVADRLGLDWVALDQATPAAERFDGSGQSIESAEAELAGLSRAVSASNAIVCDTSSALVTHPESHRLLGRRALTVWLDGDDEILASRARVDGDGPSMIGRLRSDRLVHYTTAADAIVSIDGRSPDAVADAVVAAVGSIADPRHDHILTETVTFDDGRSYPIHVGRGVSGLLAQVVPPRARKVAVITQDAVGLEVDTGREQRTFVVEDGEKAKRLEVVADLASAMAQWGMTRADAVVSVGGGVVSDLGGYLAACYHRGIPVVHLSTTLLGQIDAAIGGKCGVNLPEGKNLLGAFWQPAAVLCEIDALATLPPREFVAGMGELAKYHFLGGGELDRLPLVERVAASARIKADVVSGDEREGGRRAILNYGHTLAHALETAGRYQLRHGEAVGIGLVYAAELASRLGRIDQARVDEHRRVVARYGLQTSLPAGYEPADLVTLFRRDKKAVDGITFVLDGPEGVEPVMIDDQELMIDVLATLIDPAAPTTGGPGAP